MRATRIAAAVLLLAAMLPATATAAENGQVSAQVTVAAPCVTVGSNLDYGIAAFSTVDPFVQVTKNSSTSYTSCSVSAEKIYVRGTAATSSTSTATWDGLTGTNTCNVGPNIYGHSVADGSSNLWLTKTDQLLNAAAPAETTRTLGTGLNMPCSGSVGAGETMTFSIVITASF